MLITLEKQKLTIGQLRSGKIQENILSDYEIQTVNLLKSWLNKQSIYTILSSGSTGAPKEIQISRAIIQYSVETSLSYLDPEKNFKSALLCISPERIGGMMVLFRALEREMDLSIIKASSRLDGLPDNHFDLTSLVPMQVQYLLDHAPETLKKFSTILVGGAPLSADYCERLAAFSNLKVYHTYGMTETSSHIALKDISAKSEFYETLGDVKINTDSRGCLAIKGTVTQGYWLQTNDVVDIIQPNCFVWKGRADFVINSGGVKIHPEIVEGKLQKEIKSPFFITGVPDDRLGQKVIMVIEDTQLEEPDFEMLDRYEIPKKIYYLPKLIYTKSGKIDRISTMLNLKE